MTTKQEASVFQVTAAEPQPKDPAYASVNPQRFLSMLVRLQKRPNSVPMFALGSPGEYGEESITVPIDHGQPFFLTGWNFAKETRDGGA